ncbi:Outer membrane protein TolC [Malonomonas rubra DSM 5091]|uniref:Outer membrane protein TolC n=1 Tax=Malonomonas rubra DSM 5091 TaxID=1122189 RepID=A0A1M6NEN4_MALRU|nr:TolC family protein [Malonomonas rubra]SHJ94113.1 Outer membrane protein TolC [Malonomonas rubra DSM 5091]
MKKNYLFWIAVCFSLVFNCSLAFGSQQGVEIQNVTLQESIDQALENNRSRPASRYAVAMAEAQHKQALSAYWPQVSATGGYEIKDDDPNFIFPASNISLPTITIPGLGALPLDSIEVPVQDVKLMDNESWKASLEAQWLLYDGGMRKGYSEQTAGLVEMMKQEVRRTDLELIDTVKRYYFGAVLATKLHNVGKETFERMEATLNLTETMYKEGSGSVKKTDWLDNKVMVESIRSMVALLEKNELMAQAALANVIGRPWHESVKPIDSELFYTPFGSELDQMVSSSYQFSPDWGKLESALRAAEGGVRTAKSGHYPKVAVTGELFKWWNDYDGGMSTDKNREGWTIGFGVQIPLFSGFLTKHKVAEAKARVSQLKEQRMLLKEGIGLQLKDVFLSLNAAEKAFNASQTAMEASTENRDLNTRAYQHGLVETEKVIRAQLVEALMQAQHYKVRYDHIALCSKVNLIVGTEWENQLKGQ